MATNEPLVPSMIFRSRMTKQSSKVTEQKACRRSLFSSMSLIRTSVMTTGKLLFRVAQGEGHLAARSVAWRHGGLRRQRLFGARHDQTKIVRLGSRLQG